MRTKVYSIVDNRKTRTGHVYLNSDGSAKSDFVTSFGGMFYDEIIKVTMMDETDRKKDIQSRIPVSSFVLSDYSYQEERSDHAAITEKIKLNLLKYCSVIGNRAIFNPNPLARVGNLPYKTKERLSPILIRRSFEENDTIFFSLPEGFRTEILPPGKTFSTRFGDYSSEVSLNGNVLRYIRIFKLYKGNYPVGDYPEFVDFFEKISISDESKIIMVSSL